MTTDLRLGFGCSGAWGYRWFSERTAIALIEQAVELGIRDFDTGNFYCGGNAERRLGRALAQLSPAERGQIRISSKTGTQDVNGRLIKDFTPDTIRRDVETSLDRLGIEALDTLYLHGPGQEAMAAALPILAGLKEEELIRCVGVCSNGPEIASATTDPAVDTVMASYNLFRTTHASSFSRARQAGKRVVAIAPLAQGLYRQGITRPTSLPDIWYLLRAVVKNRAELRRARAASWLQDVPGWRPSELALGFTLANPDIDLAITTTTRSQHLRQNVAASQRPLPSDLRERLLELAGKG